MTDVSRRRLLGVTGSVLVGSLAGCSSSSSGDDTTSPDDDGNGSMATVPDGAVSDSGVVNYPEFVDGAASVTDGGRRIEYADPAATFALLAGFEGDPAPEEELQISRDLAGDVKAGFIAPVYDGGFVYHFFVNRAFVEYTDWYVVTADANGPADDRDASFTQVRNDIFHLSVTPEIEEQRVLVADYDISAMDENEGNVTGLLINRLEETQSTPESDIPQAVFAFDYDSDAGTVTITHQGGESISGENLVVIVDNNRLESQFGESDVTAGDSATVDAPPGVTVRVVYDDGDQSAILAEDDTS